MGYQTTGINLGDMVQRADGGWDFVNVKPTQATFTGRSQPSAARQGMGPTISLEDQYRAQRKEMESRGQIPNPFTGPAPSSQFPAMASKPLIDAAGHTSSIRAGQQNAVSVAAGAGSKPSVVASPFVALLNTISQLPTAITTGLTTIGESLTAQPGSLVGRTVSRAPGNIWGWATNTNTPTTGGTPGHRQSVSNTPGKAAASFLDTITGAFTAPPVPTYPLTPIQAATERGRQLAQLTPAQRAAIAAARNRPNTPILTPLEAIARGTAKSNNLASKLPPPKPDKAPFYQRLFTPIPAQPARQPVTNTIWNEVAPKVPLVKTGTPETPRIQTTGSAWDNWANQAAAEDQATSTLWGSTQQIQQFSTSTPLPPCPNGLPRNAQGYCAGALFTGNAGGKVAIRK